MTNLIRRLKRYLASYNEDLVADRYYRLKAHYPNSHATDAARKQHIRIRNARMGREFA